MTVVAALVTAACGSTVPPGEGQAASSGLDATDAPTPEGTAAPTPEGLGSGDASASTDDGTTSSTDGGSSGTPGAAGQTTGSQVPDAPSTSTPAASARPAGPGITADKITIGIGWFDIQQAEALLAPGQDPGSGRNDKSRAEAVVQWINEHGGIAGRQIDPIYHEIPIGDISTSSSRGRREQAMCSDFTEDHQAFAAIPLVATEGVFYQCAAQHNLVTVAVEAADAPVDQAWYEEIGHIWYRPAGFLADRRERMIVEQLDRRGFFAADSKVGIILWDAPPSRRAAERSLEPALKALGVEVVEREYYSDITHQWENAVLRFRSAGVTHVVWGSTACPITCTDGFMRASEAQRYRPFNGITSDNGIGNAAELSPAAQRERIVAVSWTPQDVSRVAYEASTQPTNDNDARCREISKGDDRPSSFQWFCQGLFFIKQTLEAAPELTWNGFRQAVEAPGFQSPPVNAYAAAFGPNRHDGANAVRDLRYDPKCECMRFSSPVREHG